MASLTIRKLNDAAKERLRVRAAKAGHSMEEEARIILERQTQEEAPRGLNGPEFLALMQKHFGPEHGVDLQLPPRNWGRPPVDFSE